MDAAEKAPEKQPSAHTNRPAAPPVTDAIRVVGARLHNLKNVSLTVPKNALVVLTGLSGSGKSTLAFDTLHREGQRQYLESLGMVTMAVSKPAVDSISGLSPSISVDQHLTNRSPRSTVGTVTEVFTCLRLLWARIGHRPCPSPSCGGPVPPSYDVTGETGETGGAGPVGEAAGATGEGDDEDAEVRRSVPCPHCATPVPEPVMGDFSFNKPAGACPACTGLGTVFQADVDSLLDEGRSVAGGAVRGWHPVLAERNIAVLHAAAEHYGFTFDVDVPVKELGPVQRDLLLEGVGGDSFRRHFPGTKPPSSVSRGRFEGVVTTVLRRYAERIDDADYREKTERSLVKEVCPECQGTRLRPESRAVTVRGLTITRAARMPLSELAEWTEELAASAEGKEWQVTEPVVTDLRERLRRLADVGVGYLTPAQSTPSLSAGEAQRLRLASLLGSGLTGVLYVLDEPTIGLHPADCGRLVQVLRGLRDLGNTVLVVEHDLEVLRAADHVIDIGPGAGRDGGRVVATGTAAHVAGTPGSVTGDCLSGRVSMPVPARPRRGDGPSLVIRGARAHNLKDVTARLPLGTLVAVSGPSGSGKSSLLFDILDRAARRRFRGAGELPGPYGEIEGWEHLDGVVTIDQQPISRVPRSNAATYSDAFTPIREAFAATPGARRAGFTAGHFSPNRPGGRCERCAGAGVLSVPMHFLPDVDVTCPACRGCRFRAEVLAARYGGEGGPGCGREGAGYDIAEVLEMTVDEALELFGGVPKAAARLRRLAEVGLGYLKLGQPATTLSGGEAQRIKLAKELAQRSTGRTLYLLDEPTTGLHMADTARLLGVLQQLVDAGNTVVTIEHDLHVIQAADWVIDLGPGGGAAGGEIVAEGTPAQVAGVSASRTGAFLRGGG
ncbi:excinuclease ABC subunit A [Streptomyces sp. Amel2xB2]|uniref:excinuclease ABC subunit UvrA n=1 Tax=Streptomyces sp. Amel2xB2 TaxID=1305829 RepID=UPI000DB90A60|nr:excinuclease ABC subunit UvrA [Streptomyces sp. Amel2xB2]RAJ67050.1 excinuclease ABC subunit A [Streptomyces sp. Amel2xB2]